jgi:lipopolysaccharide export LptBFGC system permease protein LptF
MLLILILIVSEHTVAIPVWLISLLVGLIASLLTSWGVISSARASLEVRAKHNEEDIKSLKEEKVDNKQFDIIVNQLNRMEKKLDEHIKESR